MNVSQKIPFDQIIKIGQRTMLNRPLFAVSWILGRFCNYSCSYCWPYANTNKSDFMDVEIYKRIAESINTQANSNNFNEFHWSFSGGEPTTYKYLTELLNYVGNLTSNYQSVHMTTNLSPGKQWWSKWISNTSRFQRKSITASYHEEFADEIEFGEKILFLMEQNVFVTINQVMVPNRFYDLYERMNRFHLKGINVTLKPQSDKTASFIVNGYNAEMIELMQNGFPQTIKGEEIYQLSLYDVKGNEYLLDQAERLNAFEYNNFKGWKCNSGYQSIIIRGNQIKRGYSCHDKEIGTVTEGFKLFTEDKVCITPSCVSSADSKIPKNKVISIYEN